jgi:Xaa-Pro aminopeptidase
MTLIADMELSATDIERMRSRLAAVRAGLVERGVEMLLISGEQDVRFLAGCFGHDTRVLVSGDQAILISDRRYEESLAPWQAAGVFDVSIANRPGQIEFIRSTLAAANCKALGIQAAHTTLAVRDGLASAFKGTELVPVSGLLAGLRMRKSPDEIASMQEAIRIQSEALHATLEELRLGMTEGQVSARLIYEMRCRGAESESFEPIVGSGANASVIHHTPAGSPVGPGVLLIDWGARVDGICSDLTRTFFLGDPDDEMKRMYRVVAAAHDASIAACQVGACTRDVDAASRNIIKDAGWGDEFPHGVGHGLGRDVHELPYMGGAGESTKLQAGMVVTIEPGIYLPGIGGVRIEDDILVTDDGPQVLSEALDCSLEGALLPLPQGETP